MSFLAVINGYVCGEFSSISNIIPLGANKFSGVVSNSSGHQTTEFFASDIQIPELINIGLCPEISKSVFLLLYMATNTTKELFTNKAERLHTSIGVKDGNIESLVNCTESSGSQMLLDDIIKKINNGSVDWGVFFYFGVNEEHKVEGISLEIIHPKFSAIYFIPVEYHFDSSGFMQIKTDKITKILSGDAIGNKDKVSFLYMNADGIQTSRSILGMESYIENGREYFKGFCLLRYENRSFRRDRVVKFIP